MDGQRFDDLARALAASTSRRRVLKTLAASAAVELLAVLTLRRAGAQPACRRTGHPCEGNRECCADLLCALESTGRRARRCCPPDATLVRNECVCPNSLMLDLDADACVCPEGTVACGGGCVDACGEGQILDQDCRCVCESNGEEPCGDSCCEDGLTCAEGTCVRSGICPNRSVCGARQYCNDEQTCLCLETPEGDIRCGQIPSCDAPRCQSSADCAQLGDGFFCDVPDSGCCGAQVSRCIAPCEAPPCPVERDCGEVCCPEGQICVDGACVATCNEDADCEDGICQEGICAPAVSCPECGECNACNAVNTGEISCEGETCFTELSISCGLACSDQCTTATLCEEVRQDGAYRALLTALDDRGYAQSEDRETLEYHQDGVLLRTILVSGYIYSDSAVETALLLYGVEAATGETWQYALLLQDGVPSSILSIGADGEVKEEFPPTGMAPAGAFNERAQQTYHAISNSQGAPTGFTGGMSDLVRQPIGGGVYCTPCRIACSLAGTYGCAFALAAVCGPGAAACVWVFRGACSVISSGLVCPVACASFCECRECRSELCEACVDGECLSTCRGGKVCQNGQCVCPDGLTECEGRCVDTQSDTQHCGGCGARCGINELCSGGECSCPIASAGIRAYAQADICCPPEQVPCGAQCCPEGQRCCAGECRDGCGGERVYCNCNQTCYDDVQVCLSECRVTLGCFTGICGPAEPGQC